VLDQVVQLGGGWGLQSQVQPPLVQPRPGQPGKALGSDRAGAGVARQGATGGAGRKLHAVSTPCRQMRDPHQFPRVSRRAFGDGVARRGATGESGVLNESFTHTAPSDKDMINLHAWKSFWVCVGVVTTAMLPKLV